MEYQSDCFGTRYLVYCTVINMFNFSYLGNSYVARGDILAVKFLLLLHINSGSIIEMKYYEVPYGNGF